MKNASTDTLRHRSGKQPLPTRHWSNERSSAPNLFRQQPAAFVAHI